MAPSRLLTEFSVQSHVQSITHKNWPGNRYLSMKNEETPIRNNTVVNLFRLNESLKNRNKTIPKAIQRKNDKKAGKEMNECKEVRGSRFKE